MDEERGEDMSVKYECHCCGVIEFDAEPEGTPTCCGEPMKKVETQESET